MSEQCVLIVKIENSPNRKRVYVGPFSNTNDAIDYVTKNFKNLTFTVEPLYSPIKNEPLIISGYKKWKSNGSTFQNGDNPYLMR